MNKIGGFTLIEVLVASILASVAVLVLVQATQMSLDGALDAEKIHRSQNSALVVEQILRSSILPGMRLPCPKTQRLLNATNRSRNHYYLEFFDRPISIFPAASHAAHLVQETGTQSSDRLKDSDVLVLRRIGAPAVVTKHQVQNKSFLLQNRIGLKAGDFSIVCDSSTAALFQVSRVSQNGRQIDYHAKPSVRPGNCANAFGGSSGCGSSPHLFDSALLAHYSATVFYVGHGHHKGEAALYRKTIVLANRKSGKLAYMLGGEVLDGVLSLRAQIITRFNGVIKHQQIFNGEALGISIELIAGTLKNNSDGTTTHVFSAAL